MTREQYLKEQLREYLLAGNEATDAILTGLNDEWYNEITKNITQFKGTITLAEYNSMTAGQEYHFNKHYNLRGDKIAWKKSHS